MIRLALAAVAGFTASAVLGFGGAGLIGGDAWAEPPAGGHSPDPPANPSRKQWLFKIRVKKGDVSILNIHSAQSKQPKSTPRVMGRYAIELYVGRELLDRVRFNVPIAGDGPTPKEDRRPFRRPTFERVTTLLTVRMADQPRATHGQLVDRATGTVTKFVWPPADARLEDPNKGDGGAPKTAPSAPSKESPDGGSNEGGSPDGSPPDAGKAPAQVDAGLKDAGSAR